MIRRILTITMKPKKTILYRYAEKMQKMSGEFYDSIQIQVPDELEADLGLPYSGGDGNALSMDVFRPAGERPAGHFLPVIIMIHGGGLFVGNARMEAMTCMRFAGRGFLVFSLSYRLLTEADACGELSDICEGFRQVEKLLPAYGGDRDRVYVVSESAGAYLAVFANAMHRSRALYEKVGGRLSNLRVRMMACFSGMFYTKKLDLIGMVYPRQIYGEKRSDKEFMKMMNPEHPEIIGNLPPMLLVSSDEDFLKKYTLKYEKALKKAGIPCRLWYYTDNKECTHAFPSLKPDLKESQEVIDQIADIFLGSGEDDIRRE